MPTTKKRPDFFNSEEGVSALAVLNTLAGDDKYNTGPSYSANSTLYPNNLIPFVDRHMVYLRDHPSIDPQLYIANVKLMTKIK